MRTFIRILEVILAPPKADEQVRAPGLAVSRYRLSMVLSTLPKFQPL